MPNLPAVAGTMQTDPRSGGIKRSSGVNVLPSVSGKGSPNTIFPFFCETAFGSFLCYARFFCSTYVYTLQCVGSFSKLIAVPLRFTEAWSEVRDDSNTEVDWILIGYDGNSKTDLTLIEKGKGGLDALSAKLPTVVSSAGGAVFGGTRLFANNKNGRFVHFVYVDENCPAMKKGRTLMYKNGVFNVLLGCDGEIEMKPGLSESTMGPIR